ncbi:cell division protein SepF [Haploplasma modicum]|jgi:cell division inhibitor SepF|uniref:cell division protein SepF n=1 Tax=Haploplasma modicum TaxID=2150 RepID=UPI00047D63AC|nr:cell division protein SepF [Haploplasma modicum]MCR1809272.1 cell division protein SepF [Haploplasma modicum]
MGFFSFLKKKPVEVVNQVEKSSLIVFEQLFEANDEYLTKLATDLINGKPLVINLEKLEIDDANKIIAFLSGVVYAINGEIIEISRTIFLFGDEDLFKDGSIKKFIDNL